MQHSCYALAGTGRNGGAWDRGSSFEAPGESWFCGPASVVDHPDQR